MNSAERREEAEKTLGVAQSWIKTGERDRPEGVPMGRKQLEEKVFPSLTTAEDLVLQGLSREAQAEYAQQKLNLLVSYLEKID